MKATVDWAAYGSRAPNGFDRAIIDLTRRLPANWLGLRLAILLRRIVTARLGDGGIDTVLWGVRLRLYPRGNACEKNALFTPHMFDSFERGVLAEAADRCLAEKGTFVFIDVGANVGLYSFFIATHTRGHARILAIEPQPGIVDRFRFNIGANPELKIELAAVALADREGEAELAIHSRDSGGSRLAGRSVLDGADTVHVPCRRLTSILEEFNIRTIDALKIDVEGSEDIVLGPFLADAPKSLLPGMILIEDNRAHWGVDVFALLEQRGYRLDSRNRHNIILRLS